MPTLKVTVGQAELLRERGRRRFKAAEAGEELEDDQPVLNFGTYDDFGRWMNPKNLELLDVIAEHTPESIRKQPISSTETTERFTTISRSSKISASSSSKVAAPGRRRSRRWPTTASSSISRSPSRPTAWTLTRMHRE